MSRHRVLIVEDEMVVQLHLQRIVEEIGHVVVGTAMNTTEAVRLAERENPELVLMDIHLADGDDGVETAKKLVRQHDCAVVFVTAYADENTIQRTTEVGAAGYLVKPFTAPSVRAAISTAIAGHGRLRSARREARALSSILDSMGDALFVVDEMDRVSFANPHAAELTGWVPREIDGRDLLEVVDVSVPSDGREVRQLIGDARSGRRRTRREGLSIRRRGGAERTVDVEVEPVQDEDAAASGALLVKLRDRSGGLRAAAEPQARTERRPFGKGTRILVYSHDTFGLGHLRRCLALIRALCKRHPEASALLVTGSPMVHRYPMPPGADYVKLPAIRKVESEQYEARTLNISRSAIRGMRSNLILHTLKDFDPNVLLVDHSPIGSKGELLPALEHLAERGGCTRILGLRDVIDDPAAVTELWRSEGIYDVLREHYDHIAVYGNRAVYDPVAEYEFPPDAAAKAHYVDYVCDRSAPVEEEPRNGDPRPVIAVTIGGGDGGGESVILPFLQMMRAHEAELDFRAEILTGPFVGEELMEQLRALAEGLPVTLRDFIPSTAALFRSAELVVATTGYNTTTDLMLHARRAVMVPRVLYRKEQLIRARRLEELGLVRCLGPEEATPEGLWEAIGEARKDEPLTRAREEGRLPLDGARNFAEFCAGIEVEVRE